MNKNFDFKVLTEKGDVDENYMYLLLKTLIEDHEVFLCIIYGSNNERTKLLQVHYGKFTMCHVATFRFRIQCIYKNFRAGR